MQGPIKSGERRLAGDADLREWRLVRIDVRSPVLPNAWPVARLELEHTKRGRVTDIASAPGAFDAAFLAASQVVGFSGRLESYEVRSHGADAEGALRIDVQVQLEMGERTYKGSSTGVDLVRCSLEAWLDAAAQFDSDRRA